MAAPHRSTYCQFAAVLLAFAAACSMRDSGVRMRAPRAIDKEDAVPARVEHSVVIAGHLYSLFVASKTESENPVIGWREPLQAFAHEVERIDPELVFLLGDTTRFGLEEEYEFVTETLAPLADRVLYVAGSHEYRNIEAFLRIGGLRNHSIVQGGTKFLLLDAKSILEEADLDFLRRELADHEDYDNVFILTHLYLANRGYPKVPLSEIDAYEPYSGESNWNQDVVPILAGKVDAVFIGDASDSELHNVRQKVGPEQILYVFTSFLFGRGKKPGQPGDGAMLFLELRYSGEDVQILPHTVPLDARHAWYRHDWRPALLPAIDGLTWTRHGLPGTTASVSLPYEWNVTKSGEGVLHADSGDWKLEAAFIETVAERGALSTHWQQAAFTGETGSELDALATRWKETVLGKSLALEPGDGLRPFGDGGLRLTATGDTEDGRSVSRWSVLLAHDRSVYSVTITGPQSHRRRHINVVDTIFRRVHFGGDVADDAR